MMHRLWQCPCNPTSAISGLIAKLRRRALRRIRLFSVLQGASPLASKKKARWQAVKRHLATKSIWPNVNQLNGSGCLSQDPRLRRVGWSVICMEQGGTIKEVCMRRVQRR